MKHLISFLIMALVFFAGCVQTKGYEKVYFETNDGVRIAGNYWMGSKEGVLLLHMMPATKESWIPFASRLNEKGFSVLAIDLRGHGESVKRGESMLDFRRFTNEEHQQSILDVEAAVNFLRSRGVDTIYIVGASIGANLALLYQSQNPEIKKVVLLSPGTNYRGLRADEYAKNLRSDQSVFIAAGTNDRQGEAYASEMATTIAEQVKGEKVVRIFDSSSHGSDLLYEFDDLSKEIVGWLTA